jgi:hypothetical protein
MMVILPRKSDAAKKLAAFLREIADRSSGDEVIYLVTPPGAADGTAHPLKNRLGLRRLNS